MFAARACSLAASWIFAPFQLSTTLPKRRSSAFTCARTARAWACFAVSAGGGAAVAVTGDAAGAATRTRPARTQSVLRTGLTPSQRRRRILRPAAETVDTRPPRRFNRGGSNPRGREHAQARSRCRPGTASSHEAARLRPGGTPPPATVGCTRLRPGRGRRRLRPGDRPLREGVPARPRPGSRRRRRPGDDRSARGGSRKPETPAKPAKPARRRSLDISDAGVRFIGAHEGFRAAAYDDAAVPPNATIGYGHVLHRGPVTAADRKLAWTQTQALDALRSDCAHAVEAVRTQVTAPLTQPQFDALCSFAFNVGGGAFAASTLLKRLNAGDLEAVPTELMKWVRAGSVRLPGLERRRAAEASLFTTGSYASEAPAPDPAAAAGAPRREPAPERPRTSRGFSSCSNGTGSCPARSTASSGPRPRRPSAGQSGRSAIRAREVRRRLRERSCSATSSGKAVPAAFRQRAARAEEGGREVGSKRPRDRSSRSPAGASPTRPDIHYPQQADRAHGRHYATPKALPLATDCSGVGRRSAIAWAGAPRPERARLQRAGLHGDDAASA